MLEKKKILVSSSYDSTIRTWNVDTGESIAVYKTSGPVHNLRIDEDSGSIQAIVNRNILYEINMSNNSVLKCIKFQNHSITSFFLKDDLMVFGNIENKLLVYNLANYNPESEEVHRFIFRNSNKTRSLKEWGDGLSPSNSTMIISSLGATTEKLESIVILKWWRSRNWLGMTMV